MSIKIIILYFLFQRGGFTKQRIRNIGISLVNKQKLTDKKEEYFCFLNPITGAKINLGYSPFHKTLPKSSL